jgi:hypothetical protein
MQGKFHRGMWYSGSPTREEEEEKKKKRERKK